MPESISLWIFGAYVVGTAFGVLVGHKLGLQKGAGLTVDVLVESGFLKSRKNSQGEIELIKYNDEV